MEHAIASAIAALAGAAAGFILTGAARRSTRPAPVPVRSEEQVRRRRRRKE